MIAQNPVSPVYLGVKRSEKLQVLALKPIVFQGILSKITTTPYNEKIVLLLVQVNVMMPQKCGGIIKIPLFVNKWGYQRPIQDVLLF